ncbi:outer dynein arm-docking complex subunit 4-like [Dysidea avara]|uniref:outer dynein arm-docking complex subunit 4-like n=1 Tax=Dysidea avara TaxID=196820 RepID=UPI003329BAD0
MYGGEEEGEDPASFAIHFAEGEALAKQGEYRKAIESYTKALDIQANEKSCLVARSKCHLQIGDAEAALQDAEASLREDKNYHRGLFQKANSLYQMGDFEYALVYYHRGSKLRPDLTEFTQGIHKAQEAINNSIGTPEQCHLEKIGDLSWFQQQTDMSKQKGGKRKPVTRPTMQAKSKVGGAAVQKSVASDKTMKHLLAELYVDREYMSSLLKDQNLLLNSKSTKLMDLIQDGLVYLDTRADFWRQQKPMYARKREQQLRRIKPSLTKPVGASGRDYTKFILKSLEEIDTALENGDAENSLKQARAVLKTVQSLNEKDVPSKYEFMASLYSSIGNAQVEMGEADKAMESYSKDYQLSTNNKLSREALSRALDNLGRVYSIKGDHKKAIEHWKLKLPMVESAEESTWLFHEIGRCHLELGNFEEAEEYGEKSLGSAEQAQDTQWQLNATVLKAQSQVKMDDYVNAAETFEQALKLAVLMGDEQAQDALKMALKDVSSKAVQGLSKKEENGEADKQDTTKQDEDNKQTDEESKQDNEDSKQDDGKQDETSTGEDNEAKDDDSKPVDGEDEQ